MKKLFKALFYFVIATIIGINVYVGSSSNSVEDVLSLNNLIKVSMADDETGEPVEYVWVYKQTSSEDIKRRCGSLDYDCTEYSYEITGCHERETGSHQWCVVGHTWTEDDCPC